MPLTISSPPVVDRTLPAKNTEAIVEASVLAMRGLERPTDLFAIESRLKEAGVKGDVWRLANEISARLVRERFDADGTWTKKGITPQSLGEVAEVAARLLDLAPERRLPMLGRGMYSSPSLRADLQLLLDRDELTQTGSARARLVLGRQADQAALKFQALAAALGLDVEQVKKTIACTTIDTKAADRLIGEVFGEYLQGVPLDKTQSRVRLVSNETLAAQCTRNMPAGLSWLAQGLKALLHDDSVPYQLPWVEVDGKRLLARNANHFGNGGAVALGLREYAHKDIVAAFGGGADAEVLAQGLAHHLATWVNTALDDRPLARPAPGDLWPRPWGAPAIDTYQSSGTGWWELENLLGWRAMADGFFKDPAGLVTALETALGKRGWQQVKAILIAADHDRVSRSTIEKELRAITGQAKSWQVLLPGVPFDIDGADPKAVATALRQSTAASPQDLAASITAVLEGVPAGKRAATASALVMGFGDLLPTVPRQALAVLGAELFEDNKLWTLLQMPQESVENVWIKTKYEAWPIKPAPGVSPEAITTFEAAVAEQTKTALRQVVAQSEPQPDHIKEVADEAVALLQSSLAKYVAPEALRQACELISGARLGPGAWGYAFDSKDDAVEARKLAFLWAQLAGEGKGNTRVDFVIAPGDPKTHQPAQAVLLPSIDTIKFVDVAMPSLVSPKLAAALPADVVAAMRLELTGMLPKLLPDGVAAPDPMFQLAEVAGRVPGQVVHSISKAIEAMAKQKSAATPEALDRTVAELWAEIVIKGNVDLLKTALDNVGGKGAFDALCELLPKVARDTSGFETLRPWFKRIRVKD